MRQINKIIVHCSATREGENYTVDTIRSWHVDGRGWSDIGYHWVIELDGSTNEGRSEDINGAHCRGHNSDSIGICYVGGSDSEGNPKDTRTEGQRDALVALIKEILDRYPDAEVFGHRDFSTKACPSFDAKTEYAGL